MLFKKLQEVPEFIAGDDTRLREILHPKADAVSIGYSLAHAWLPVGEASLPHRLQSSETYFILQGKGRLYIEDQEFIVEKNSLVYVPPKALQFLENIGSEELIFLCIVEPFWTPEDEDVE